MKKRYIYTAAFLMAAASFTGCSSSTQEAGTAKEKAPAAATVAAPAKFDRKATQKALDELSKKYRIRSNRWDNAKIAEEYRAFYAANKGKMDEGALVQYGVSMIRNGIRLEDPSAVKEGIAIVKANSKKAGDEFCSIINSSLDEGNFAIELKYMEELFDAEKNTFEIGRRYHLYCKLVSQSLRYHSDINRVEHYLSDLNSIVIPPSGHAQIMENKRKEVFRNIIGTAIGRELAVGTKLYNKYRSRFSEVDNAELCAAFCRTAIHLKDRELFDKMIKPIWALPDINVKFDLLRNLANRAKGNVGKTILAEMLKNKNMSPGQRYHTLMATCQYPNVYVYHFHEQGSYKKARAIHREALKLAKANPKTVSAGSLLNPIHRAMHIAYGFGDYPYFAELEKTLLELDKNPTIMWGPRVTNLVRQDKTAEAVALLDLVLADKRANAQTKQDARLWKYFITGGTFDGFDAAFADLKFNSEQKMTNIRRVGAMFFRAKKFEKARALNDEVVKKMFRPAEINKRYTVKYMKRAPKTAEAWSYTDGYRNWDGMETRFSQYIGYDVHHDAKLLKDAELTPLKDEYRAGLHIVYDDLGVHIYGRFNDPNVEEVNLGKRKGASLEWLFRPGKEHAYYSFYFNALPDTEDPHYVNWAAPTKNYRLTYETVFKDAVTTPEGYASHAFIPWIAVYDKLPSKDNQWVLGLQVKNGDFRTLSGLVHEAGRALKLDFEFTPEQRAALEKTICIQAFNRYNAIRKDAGGMIRNWNDYLLGDPEFYEKVLKDYIAELDEAGKKLQEAKTNAEIHELFVKYAPQWAEIRYILEEKRAAYLKDALFK